MSEIRSSAVCGFEIILILYVEYCTVWSNRQINLKTVGYSSYQKYNGVQLEFLKKGQKYELIRTYSKFERFELFPSLLK